GVAPEFASGSRNSLKDRNALLRRALTRLDQQLDIVEQLRLLRIARMVEREELRMDGRDVDGIDTRDDDWPFGRHIAGTGHAAPKFTRYGQCTIVRRSEQSDTVTNALNFLGQKFKRITIHIRRRQDHLGNANAFRR